MRITIIYRDFWPDNSPYAQMLFKLAQGFATAGHEVSVLTGQPSHNWHNRIKSASYEIIEGIRIRRLPLLPEFGRRVFFRLLNTILFSLQFIIFLLCKRSDLVMVVSTPPVINAAIVRYVSLFKGFQYLYHCQDLHPEALLIGGVLKNNYLYNLLLQIDAENVRKSKGTVVLSEDMKQTLISRGVDDQNIHVINNFIFEKFAPKSVIEDAHPDKPLRVLFAGNFGRFQGLDRIIDAAYEIKERVDVEYIFLGEGIERVNLEKQARDMLGENVHFLGYQPIQMTLEEMRKADIGLVSIMPDVIRVAYPSKTMMYLSMGLPMLAMVEADSSLAEFISKHELGYVSDANNVLHLVETIKAASQNKMKLRKDKERIKDIADKYFAEDVIIDEWKSLLFQIENSLVHKKIQKTVKRQNG